MIEETLQEVGLNRRESICYIALLELGSSKVGNILKKTGIPSSKIYEILDKLIKRGLVSHIIKRNVKYYQASNPKVLISYIEEKKKKVEEIVPELILKQKLSKKQSAELYEGQKAIFSLLTNLIKDARPKELYLVFSINEENKNEQANLFFRNITLRRKEKRLDVRLLRNIKYYKKEKHTKTKVRHTNFSLPQGITIFRNYIILLTWTDYPIAIKIESDIVSNQMRDFFLDLWKIARR
ncbi:hypothetical protein FJZ19_00760 [Candidatus Pacearchaeota archaeon]|nr:hypothetical protein [Candidatus Pacearchaeota archaeon]